MQDDKQKINKVRLCADSGKFDSPKNDLTNLPISFRAGDSVCFDIVLLHNNKLVDCSNLSTITLEILDVGAPNSPLPRNPRLLVKKIVEASQVQTTLTQEEFESGGKHLSILLDSSDTALKQKYYYLKLCAFDEYGNRATFASGWILIEQVYGSEIITDKEQINFIEELEGIVNRQIARVDETLEQFDVLKCELENKADKSSTLLGYGINDAYTKAEADLKISTATQALQLFKSNSGMLHFNKGATGACAITNFGNIFSMCGIIQMSAETFASIGDYQRIFGGYSSGDNSTIVLQKSASNQLYCRALVYKESPAIDYGASFDASIITDGKPHCIVCTYNLGTIKVYVDGNLVKTASKEYVDNITPDSYQIGDANSAIDGISNVAIFNFDMSDANAPYTLSNYQQGKPIPPEYLLGAGERFNVKNGMVENTDYKITGYNCTGTFTQENDIYTIGKADITTGAASASLMLKPNATMKAGSEVEVYIKKVPTSETPYLIRFTPNLFSITNDGDRILLDDGLWAGDECSAKMTLTRDCNGMFIQIGSSRLEFSFTDLRVKVNGALLALENYTITNGTTKQIFDYSGNANDATCSGSVKGDNDNRVQRLVDFIKA